jgi:ketosteroid isomerase-like protein
MSQENVEVMRRGFDSFNRRDLAAALESFDSDAEWVPYLAALEEDTYRGRDEIRTMWGEVLRDFPDFRIELIDVIAARGNSVVAKVEFCGMGRASGADVRTTVFQAVSFRDGRTIRVQGCRTGPEALEAVGLRESPDHP